MIPMEATSAKSQSGKKTTTTTTTSSLMATIEEATHKCPQCDKTVFRVEQLLCAGKYWHKTCFQCGGRGDRGCGRKLTSTNCSVQDGEPYCRNCYGQFLVKTAAADEAIRASDSGFARKEMPTLLAHVKVSERANLFLNKDSATGGSPGAKGIGGIGQGNKCVQCNKSVYPAEELRAQGMLWHKNCFTCGALRCDDARPPCPCFETPFPSPSCPPLPRTFAAVVGRPLHVSATWGATESYPR